MTTTAYGFRVVGHKAAVRRPVDWRAAFVAHCAADERAEGDRESFLSHFTFGPDLDDYLTANGSEAGFTGQCGADWLFCDIDREDDLSAALHDARRLVGAILDRYRDLDDEALLIFLSGAKGLHVGIPTALWQPARSAQFHEIARRFCQAHADRAGIKIDTQVYSRTRLFRAPNTRHPKTGLFKRRLALDELLHLNVTGIVELAREPDPFDVPIVTATSPAAAADWAEAAGEAERREAERRENGDRRPRLVRATLDFIRRGAEKGERHVRLFRAAANLAELNVPAAVIHALLSEPALDLTLTPGDVTRQIDCGIAHARGVPRGATDART